MTEPAVTALALQLHGDRGPVFGPVDLEIEAGTLTLVQGPQGAGRSSLLLTLAGRMVPDASSDLVVLGHRLPAQRTTTQREVALAGFAGIDQLDDSVTVGDHVRERLAWLAPWYRRAPRPDQATVDRVLAPVFGDLRVPGVDTVVWHLDEVDALLLRIALAMAQRPRLLVVDDVDQVHDRARRRIVWDRLAELAATGVTVVASCADPDEAVGTRWTVLPVSPPPSRRSAMLSLTSGTELRRFGRGRLPRLAVAAMLLVPLLYGALYLWAFWNPTGHLDAMPVALVNADAGADRDGTRGHRGPGPHRHAHRRRRARLGGHRRRRRGRGRARRRLLLRGDDPRRLLRGPGVGRRRRADRRADRRHVQRRELVHRHHPGPLGHGPRARRRGGDRRRAGGGPGPDRARVGA